MVLTIALWKYPISPLCPRLHVCLECRRVVVVFAYNTPHTRELINLFLSSPPILNTTSLDSYFEELLEMRGLCLSFDVSSLVLSAGETLLVCHKAITR